MLYVVSSTAIFSLWNMFVFRAIASNAKVEYERTADRYGTSLFDFKKPSISISK